MRSFYIAIGVMVTIATVITLNYIYINGVSEKLSDITDEAINSDFENCEEMTKNIRQYWESKKNLVSLSVNFNEINEVDDCITVLVAACSEKNEYEYQKYLQMLAGTAPRIARLEAFTLSNIF